MVRDTKSSIDGDADGDKGYLPASNDIFSLSVSFESTSSTSMEAMMNLVKATRGYQQESKRE